jgi:hypothetical protein
MVEKARATAKPVVVAGCVPQVAPRLADSCARLMIKAVVFAQGDALLRKCRSVPRRSRRVLQADPTHPKLQRHSDVGAGQLSVIGVQQIHRVVEAYARA